MPDFIVIFTYINFIPYQNKKHISSQHKKQQQDINPEYNIYNNMLWWFMFINCNICIAKVFISGMFHILLIVGYGYLVVLVIKN